MSTTEISDRIDLNSDFVSVDDGEDESQLGDGVSGSSICDIDLETVVDHSIGPMEGVEGVSNELGNHSLGNGVDLVGNFGGNEVDDLGGVSEVTGNEFKASNLYVDLSSCIDRAKSGNGVCILLQGVSEIADNEFNPSNLFVDLSLCIGRGNSESGVGLACSCLTDDLVSSIRSRVIVNGETSRIVGRDRFLGVDSFEPAKLIQCIKMLAVFLHSRVDRLEYAITQAQVLAFDRSKGFPNVPKFKIFGGLLEDDEGSMSMISDRQDSHCLGENLKVEPSPTALILNFADFNSIPSVTSLIRLYSEFGPLNESGTEVLKKSCRAKVVFKRRVDAEKAFSSPGKYKMFGPSLVSYSLKCLSSSTGKASHHSRKKHRKDPRPE